MGVAGTLVAPFPQLATHRRFLLNLKMMSSKPADPCQRVGALLGQQMVHSIRSGPMKHRTGEFQAVQPVNWMACRAKGGARGCAWLGVRYEWYQFSAYA